MGIDESRDKSSTALADLTVPQLCDLHYLSTNWAVQTMAYRLLSQVVRRDTLALVLEIEATIGDEAAEEARSIQLPASLIDIVKAGVVIDWHSEPSPSDVCAVLVVEFVMLTMRRSCVRSWHGWRYWTTLTMRYVQSLARSP